HSRDSENPGAIVRDPGSSVSRGRTDLRGLRDDAAVFQCGWNSPATALSPMSRLRYEARAHRPAAGLLMFPKPKPALTPNTYAYASEPLVKPTGFREYDARWLLEKEINLMGVQALGLGLGTLIHELGVAPNVVTGHDFRAYSASVKTALTSGLMAAGCNVHDIGLA